MARVQGVPAQRREFITDGDRSALRATWHNDAGYVVISLWRGEACVATSHLTPREAGRLAAFIASGLADLAHEAVVPPSAITTITPRASWRWGFRKAVRFWRDNVGRSLEQIARRLRVQ